MSQAKKIIGVCSGWLLLFGFVPIGLAAEIRLASPRAVVGIGDTFEIRVELDAGGEAINAAGGMIAYPRDYLKIVDIRDGNSRVPFWIERPQAAASTDAEANKVRFSGIIPGGVTGSEAYLFSLIFLAEKAGVVQLIPKNTQILRHDGQGSAVPSVEHPLAIAIVDKLFGIRVLPIKDEDAPESFAPKIGQQSDLFSGDWFAAFATQDKKSGVQKYQIYESKESLTPAELAEPAIRWIDAESPYRLTDQSRRSYAYVKAIDRSGHSRIETLPPAPIGWRYESSLIFGILVMLAVFGLWITQKLWPRHR